MSRSQCPMGAPVVDYFDHNAPSYVTDRYDWFETIRRDVGPVFWSPHYGGFWVVIGYPELTQAARNWETFSSRADFSRGCPVEDIELNGLFVPPRTSRQARQSAANSSAGIMLQEDPPEWGVARAAVAPLFSLQAAEKWRERIQRLIDACIDRRIESGRVDLATDIFNIVPAIFSLELVGLPTDNYADVAWLSHTTSHLSADDPRWEEVLARGERAGQPKRLADAVAARKTDRRGDVISTVLNARDKGADLSDEDIAALGGLIIGAGIDTTSALIGTTFVNLTRFPSLRKRLQEHPEDTRDAFDEFMRIGTPTQGLCRTVMRDTELGGQQMRRGDVVMLCWPAANRDPREYPDPLDIKLERKPKMQVGFGFGNHRCLGQHYARVEFEIIFNTVLRRMPDIEIDVAAAKQFDNCGIVTGWQTLPATFTPGKRIGADPGVENWDYNEAKAHV
ncbi:MAG: cytochrome [Phenylobacterium sp.]|nr:cytochrome [Phenylobacterium sp.]